MRIPILAVALTLALALYARGQDPLRTLGMNNGKHWAAMNEVGDLLAPTYVEGYLDAIRLRSDDDLVDHAIKCRLAVMDISKGVTAFYASDPAYAQIPIPSAIRLSIHRACGTSREDVNRRADELLKTINQ